MSMNKRYSTREKERDLERAQNIIKMQSKLVCCDNCHTWQHPKGKKGNFTCPKCGSDMHEN